MNKLICRIPLDSDYSFVSDCIFNDIGINDIVALDYDFKNSSIKQLVSFVVNTDMNSIFIANKNGVDIGVIISYVNEKSYLDGKIFVNKKACKMSAITLIKALVFYNCVFATLFTPSDEGFKISLPYEHPILKQASFFLNSILNMEYNESDSSISGINTDNSYESLINAFSYNHGEGSFECII